ncbi:MAG: flagellar motor protein MotA [Geminicoccaceae bacterium]|nr:MAG: flagellar motor protein MotA [Geminicoccaceae bacterium]
MMRPQYFINIILLALLATAAVVALLADVLWTTFLYNPWLNGTIGFVFLIGVAYAIGRIWRLRAELRWIEAFRTNAPGFSTAEQPRLLAPLATLLTEQERRGRSTLTTVSVRYLLDSVQSRLDEQRDNARYLTGLLIFLGLLGTFWGLLLTISAVAEVIAGLSVSVDTVATFSELQDGLAAPLSGMGIAFSSSLFGLAGSLVLGFLDLQANRAQNEFFDDLEEWLSSLTRLSGGPLALDGGDAGRAMPTYVQALLERSAESQEELVRILGESEATRRSTEAAVIRLGDHLERLTQQLTAERAQLDRFVACVAHMESVLKRQGSEGIVLDAASRAHLANLDASMQRLVDEATRGRAEAVESLRREIRLVTRTIALASGEPDPGH